MAVARHATVGTHEYVKYLSDDANFAPAGRRPLAHRSRARSFDALRAAG